MHMHTDKYKWRFSKGRESCYTAGLPTLSGRTGAWVAPSTEAMVITLVLLGNINVKRGRGGATFSGRVLGT